MDKRLIDIHFPLAGVDRSLSYQRQHPYTTPRAINVWPDGQLDGRERGGSRPGIDTYVHEILSLFSPVRMISKVGLQEDLQAKAQQSVPLRSILTAGDWVTPTWNTGAFQVSEPGIVPVGVARSSLFSPFQSVKANSPITILLDVCPKESSAGQYFIYVGHDGSYANGNTVRLAIDDAGGYSGDFTNSSGAVQSLTAGADGSKSGGTFRVQVIPGSPNWSVKVYWKSHPLGTFTASGAITARWGFGMQAVGTAGGCITNFSVQYQSSIKEFEARRDILVAMCGGKIFYETAPKTMTAHPANVLSSDKRIQSVDYLQKLYIADYGKSLSGTTGSLASPAYTQFTDSGIDFGAQGIDTSYVVTITQSAFSQNEKQQVVLQDTDGGTFKLIYDGSITNPIAWNASTSAVKSALEELPSIGTVTVTSPVAKTYVVEFGGVNVGRNMLTMDFDSSGLTNTGAAIPSMLITTIQQGKSGDAAAGVYEIASVSGTTITLTTRPTVGVSNPINGIVYTIGRATRVFDPKTATISVLVATKGIAPSGAKLIAVYRDRLVLGNLPDYPHQWFMSRQGDVTDYDYSATDVAAAVSGSTGHAGTIGDPLTAIIPHSSRCMIFGCYSSLWIMRGDPANGGELDNVSYTIGIVDSHAWCHVPTGELIFLSQDGLYVLPAGCAGIPYSLSRERLPKELICIDPGQHAVSLTWDTMHRGVHIFLTREDSLLGSHWFYDWETKSFWEMAFQYTQEPLVAFSHTPLGECQQVLLGCRDGFIRHFSDAYWTDSDGAQINSELLIGPIKLNTDYREGVLTEMQFDLGKNSGAVQWSVLSGETAEHAYYSGTRDTGVLGELNSWNIRPRVRGHSVFVKLVGAEKRPWVYERGGCVVRTAGRRKRRW